MTIGTIGALVLLFLLTSRTMAQTVPGVIDNYSGSASAWLNPSNISTTFVHDDIGLMGWSFSFNNDFAYLPRFEFWPSLNGLMAENGTWATFEGRQLGKDYYYLYDEDEDWHHAYQSMDVVFPSLMMTLQGKHALTLNLRSRLYTTATRMPWEIPVLITEELKLDSLYDMPFASEGMRFGMMAWEEIGLGYSTTLFDQGELKMDVGVTGKLMMGVTGTTMRANDLHYEVLNADHLHFDTLDGDLHLAFPMSYEDDFHDLGSFLTINPPFFKGFGFGADVGFNLTYKRNTVIHSKPRSACDDQPVKYYWRLGVSLLDVGRVRFSDNVLSGHIVGEDFEVHLHEFNALSTIHGGADHFDTLVGNQETAFDNEKPFFIGMPTALSAQFDLNVINDFYCNVTWIQPLSRWLYDDAVEREPLLSLTPRYETSLLGVMMPLTLYGYRYVTTGAFVRIGPLTIGTNDLISLMGLGKTRNIDFMMSIRLKLDRGTCLFDPLYDACGDRVWRR